MRVPSAQRSALAIASLMLMAASVVSASPARAAILKSTSKVAAPAADPSDLTVSVSADETGLLTVTPAGPVFDGPGICTYMLTWPLGTDINGTHSDLLSTKVAPSEDGTCPVWTVRLPADEFPGGEVDARVQANQDGGFSYDVTQSTESGPSTGAVTSSLPIAWFDSGTLVTGVQTTWTPEVVGSEDAISTCTFSHGEFASDNTLISGGLDYDHAETCLPVIWTPAGTYIDAGQALITSGAGGDGAPGEDAGFDSSLTFYVYLGSADDPSATPTDAPSGSPTDAPTDSPTAAPSDAPSDSPSASPSNSLSPSTSPSVSPTPVPCLTPTVIVEGIVASGSQMHLHGCGFDSNDQITLTLSGDPDALGQVTADADGSFTVAYTVPATLTGDHTITATTDTASASCPVSIVAAAAATPPSSNAADSGSKGSSSPSSLVLALLLAVFGLTTSVICWMLARRDGVWR